MQHARINAPVRLPHSASSNAAETLRRMVDLGLAALIHTTLNTLVPKNFCVLNNRGRPKRCKCCVLQ